MLSAVAVRRKEFDRSMGINLLHDGGAASFYHGSPERSYGTRVGNLPIKSSCGVASPPSSGWRHLAPGPVIVCIVQIVACLLIDLDQPSAR